MTSGFIAAIVRKIFGSDPYGVPGRSIAGSLA